MMASLEIAMYVEYSLGRVNVVDMKDVHAGRTAKELVGVNAMDSLVQTNPVAGQHVTATAECGRGHGKLYKDWSDEWGCPICGYHKYGD